MTFAYQTHLRGALPTLPSGHAHIWQFDVTAEIAARCERLALLSTSERIRAGNIRHTVTRQEFVSGRTMLRLLLEHYLGRDARGLLLQQGSNGKPFLEDAPISFNVAHSSSRILLAITREGSIGVDLEAHSTSVDIDALIPQVFPANLTAHLSEMNALERHREFFALWAAREAVSKAHGGGLSTAIDWSTNAAGRRIGTVRQEDEAKQFVVVPLACGESYSGALACEQTFERIDILCVPPMQVLNALMPARFLSAAAA